MLWFLVDVLPKRYIVDVFGWSKMQILFPPPSSISTRPLRLEDFRQNLADGKVANAMAKLRVFDQEKGRFVLGRFVGGGGGPVT